MGTGAESLGYYDCWVLTSFQHTAMIPPCASYLFDHNRGVLEGITFDYFYFERDVTVAEGKAGPYGQGTVRTVGVGVSVNVLFFLFFLSTDTAYISGNVHTVALSLLAVHGLTEEVDHSRHVAEVFFAWLPLFGSLMVGDLSDGRSASSSSVY
jgi:hypothetical protein